MTYRKSSIRSRPLIKVYSIRNRTSMIIGYTAPTKNINIIFFWHFWDFLWAICYSSKNVFSRNYTFYSTSNTSLGNFGPKIIQSGLLIEDVRYIIGVKRVSRKGSQKFWDILGYVIYGLPLAMCVSFMH